MHSALFFECLIYSMIIISLPYSSSGTPFLRNIGKLLFIILFFYLLAVRWKIYKNSSLNKFNLKLGFDEYIIIFISTLGIILWVFNPDIGIRGLRKPFLFMAVYLSISSCAKMIKVDKKLLIRILFFYLSVVFIHLIAEYIYSFHMFFDYISGLITYRTYVLNSWNLLYPNYNFFAKNLMVGFICSLSLYLYFLVKY